MTEEPMQHECDIDNEAPPAKVFDYAKIVADRLRQPFDYKNTYGRLAPVELRKKTFDELVELADASDSDSDDVEPVELHACAGERSMKTLTNIPVVHAFNAAEEAVEKQKKLKKKQENLKN